MRTLRLGAVRLCERTAARVVVAVSTFVMAAIFFVGAATPQSPELVITGGPTGIVGTAAAHLAFAVSHPLSVEFPAFVDT